MPQAPPLRGPMQAGNQQILLAQWAPYYFTAQYCLLAQLIPAPQTPPTPPPPPNRALQTILASWSVDQTTIYTAPSAAGSVAIVPDFPPPPPRTNLDILARSWIPPVFQWLDCVALQLAPKILIPPIPPDQPPVRYGMNDKIIAAGWIPPYQPISRAGNSAPNLPPPPVDVQGQGAPMLLMFHGALRKR